jgi:hypothetical protein
LATPPLVVRDEKATDIVVVVVVNCRIDLYEIKSRLRRRNGLRAALARPSSPLNYGTESRS